MQDGTPNGGADGVLDNEIRPDHKNDWLRRSEGELMEVDGARDSDGCAIYCISSSNSLPSLPSTIGSTTKRGVVFAGQSVSSCALAGEEKIPSVATATITSTIISISMIPIEY